MLYVTLKITTTDTYVHTEKNAKGHPTKHDELLPNSLLIVIGQGHVYFYRQMTASVKCLKNLSLRDAWGAQLLSVYLWLKS